jgi:integrase/recombinase XerD
MASLRKLKGKWYVRVRFNNAKEKLIPTYSGDERIAKQKLRLIQDKEFLVKAKLLEEFELEPLTLRDAKEKFLAYCKRKNLRVGTIDSYTTSIENLFNILKPSGSVRTLTNQTIHKLQDHLTGRKLKETSININLRSIRAFSNWLFREKHTLKKVNIEFMKVDKSLPKFLLPDELEKIYSLCEDDKMKSTFRVYEHLGLRLEELHHCVREDDFVKVTAKNAKSRRDRIVPLPAKVQDDFDIATTDPYRTERISKTFTRLRKKAGIGDEKSLHSLRHTFAIRMLVETSDVKLVKDMLGHSDIKTTELYLNFPPDYLKSVLTRKKDEHAQIAIAVA